MIDHHNAHVQETLIGRSTCEPLSESECAVYAGHRVLVTGAGGTVGSQIARMIAACDPDRMTLVDHSEYLLFQIERELRGRWPDLRIDAVLGDITRARVIRTACTSAIPDVVFHAAAYKHVTMLERDLCAAVQINVLGTHAVAQAAKAIGARFVLISSDKAVNPRSVMGATKRLAEMVTLAQMDASFEPVVVRFGNVLGSSGSVLELMVDCLNHQRPIAITHPDATRYFMTIGEAATLVLRSDLLRLGGEVCWLEMGRPIKIVEIVNRLLRMAKKAGMPMVPVSFIGLRPGEKLDEQLTMRGMDLARTDHARVWIAHQKPVPVDLIQRTLRALRADVSRGDGLSALTNLCAAVPEYEPSEEARMAAGGATLVAPWSSKDMASQLVA
jgi:O-antigen biosynthesis protein WbqV